MKTKRFDKKLILNKKTIALLNNGEMNVVAGGYSVPGLTCRLCPTYQIC
jgi:hypothetical protein